MSDQTHPAIWRLDVRGVGGCDDCAIIGRACYWYRYNIPLGSRFAIGTSDLADFSLSSRRIGEIDIAVLTGV